MDAGWLGPAAEAVGFIATFAIIGMTVAAFPRLPERMPVHFDLSGRVNAYGPRGVVWLPVGFACVLFIVLTAVDPGLPWTAPALLHVAPAALAGSHAGFPLMDAVLAETLCVLAVAQHVVLAAASGAPALPKIALLATVVILAAATLAMVMAVGHPGPAR